MQIFQVGVADDAYVQFTCSDIGATCPVLLQSLLEAEFDLTLGDCGDVFGGLRRFVYCGERSVVLRWKQDSAFIKVPMITIIRVL